MLTLRQALDAIAPVTAPSARFAHPKIKIENNTLYAYNGQIAARAKFGSAFYTGPDDGRPIVVDAETFAKVWSDTCSLQHKGDQIVIKAKRARYTLPLAPIDEFACPNIAPATQTLPEAARDAIHMAAKFASDNAIHMWACGVTLTGTHAVATNNVAVVRVECETEYAGTIPFWAVQTLRKDGACPRITLDANSVTLSYDDGVDLKSQLLSAEMPAKLFDLVRDLTDADVPTTVFSGVLEDVFALGGRHCLLDLSGGLVTVTPEAGFEAAANVLKSSQEIPPILLQGAIARIILENATHVGFDQSPQRLTFSRDANPKFRGICSAITIPRG